MLEAFPTEIFEDIQYIPIPIKSCEQYAVDALLVNAKFLNDLLKNGNRTKAVKINLNSYKRIKEICENSRKQSPDIHKMQIDIHKTQHPELYTPEHLVEYNKITEEYQQQYERLIVESLNEL